MDNRLNAENWSGYLRWLGVVAVSVSFMGLAGCSGLPVQESVDPVQSVTLRAGERWGFLMQGKLDNAYGYISPLARQAMSLDRYKGTIRQGVWDSAVVEKVECGADDVCAVTVKIRYAVPMGRVGGVFHGSTALEERWRKHEQQWWFVPDQ